VASGLCFFPYFFVRDPSMSHSSSFELFCFGSRLVLPSARIFRPLHSGSLLHHHNLRFLIDYFLRIQQRWLLIGWLFWLISNLRRFSMMQFDFLLDCVQVVTFSYRLLKLCSFSNYMSDTICLTYASNQGLYGYIKTNMFCVHCMYFVVFRCCIAAVRAFTWIIAYCAWFPNRLESWDFHCS